MFVFYHIIFFIITGFNLLLNPEAVGNYCVESGVWDGIMVLIIKLMLSWEVLLILCR